MAALTDALAGGQAAQVTKLDLKGRKLRDSQAEQIVQLIVHSNASIVDLEENELGELDVEFPACLSSLNLSRNMITSISGSLSALAGLRSLDLSSNRLSSLAGIVSLVPDNSGETIDNSQRLRPHALVAALHPIRVEPGALRGVGQVRLWCSGVLSLL